VLISLFYSSIESCVDYSLHAVSTVVSEWLLLFTSETFNNILCQLCDIVGTGEDTVAIAVKEPVCLECTTV